MTELPKCPECGTTEWYHCEEGVTTFSQQVLSRDGELSLDRGEYSGTPGTENMFFTYWACGNDHRLDDMARDEEVDSIEEILEMAL